MKLILILCLFILSFQQSRANVPSIQKDIPIFTSMQETLDWFTAKESELSARDRRGLFLRVYHEVTLEMVNMFDENKFQNPEWVRQLMFEYLSLYRNALECDQSRQCPVSPAWQKAFHENRRNRKMPAIQLLLAISAHVNRDLPVALAHIEADFSSRSELRDFQRISEIFKRRMPQLIKILQKYQRCRISSQEQREINSLINWVMSVTREKAWNWGRTLSKTTTARSESHVMRQIEEHTARENISIQYVGPIPAKVMCL